MTKDEINKQIKYLRSQKENPTGNYRMYLVNLYNLFYKGAKANGTNWCSNVDIPTMIKAAYSNVETDHESLFMVQRWKNDLKKLGYICDRKVNGEWRTYILKELDF